MSKLASNNNDITSMKPELPECLNRIGNPVEGLKCESNRLVNTPGYISEETCLRNFKGEWRPCPYAGVPNDAEPEQPSRGLGDTVAKITEATGISKVIRKVTKGKCGCAKRQQKLNHIFPYGSPPIAPPRQHPLKPVVTKWAVGVTSAPRKAPTLDRCVESLMSTGFDELTVFAEPGTNLSNLPDCVDTISRPATIADPRFESEGRFGVWRNYVQTMADLLVKHPDAEALFIVQDDMVFCNDLRDFLDRDLWPANQTGAVSVYCPNFPQYESAKAVGPKRINQRYLMGACALIYPRHIVEEVLASPFARNWKGRARGRTNNPVDKKAADAWIGDALKKLKRQVHYYTPSLCQHVARFSTVGHKGPNGKRKSAHFPGEDKSAFDVMAGDSIWLRYNQPSGIQRFAIPRGPEPVEPVSIVIPAVDSLDLTEKCIEHIAHGTEIDCEVIYIDNGSESGTAERVEAVAENLGLPIKVIVNSENRGFSVAVNQGIEMSAGHDVLILNNDCLVSPGCIDTLHKHLHWHPRAGAVGPLTNDHGMNSKKNSDRIRFGGFGQERVSTHDRLPFFCTLLHRSAVARVGKLSEHPDLSSGLGADDLWCHAARKKNFRLLIAYDAYAEHLHSETFRRTGQNRRAQQKKAAKTLRVLKGRV